MDLLDDHEYEWVLRRLEDEGLDQCPWREEILDHFCCFIESHRNLELAQAYALARRNIAPMGLIDIETEFLHQQKQQKMKNTLILFGFLAAAFVSLGLMFKTFFWPGANILLVLGSLWVLMTCLLAAVYLSRHGKDQPRSFWIRSRSVLLALPLIVLGFLFKVFLLPGANIMLGAGMILLNFIFFPSLFYHLYRQPGLFR